MMIIVNLIVKYLFRNAFHYILEHMHIGNRHSRTLPHKLNCKHKDCRNKESVYARKNNNVIAKYNFDSKFFNNVDRDLF